MVASSLPATPDSFDRDRKCPLAGKLTKCRSSDTTCTRPSCTSLAAQAAPYAEKQAGGAA